MTDDPYPSLQPVVNAISGFFIASVALSLPLFAVVVTPERVKSPYKDTTPQVETTLKSPVKFH